MLLLSGEGLPWEEWAEEFRNSLPAELAKFVEEKSAGAAASDHTKSIKERLRDIMDLYRVSRYKPSPEGAFTSDPLSGARLKSAPDAAGAGRSAGTNPDRDSGAATGATGKRQSDVGNIYHLFEKKDGTASTRIKTDPFPETKWVSISDNTRQSGDLEDRAAKFLKEQNLLFVNADFRVFSDMIDHFWTLLGKQPGTRDAVQDVVRAWFEQAIVETILGIQAMRNSKEWSDADIEKSLSEESLTAVVMQRYHVNYAVRRELGAKFGKIGSTAKQ